MDLGSLPLGRLLGEVEVTVTAKVEERRREVDGALSFHPHQTVEAKPRVVLEADGVYLLLLPPHLHLQVAGAVTTQGQRQGGWAEYDHDIYNNT